MITRPDEGPDFEPDDPLTIILGPPADRLGPPPGRYETIRRTAARRRLVRAAAVAAATCAAVALIALPLHFARNDSPTFPSVPMAPRPATSPSPAPPASRTPDTPPPTEQPPRPVPSTPPTTSDAATIAPSATPPRAAEPSAPRGSPGTD
ncbi:hypothetical protein PV726_16840 [Streptomyces europaeiscabiei]|uniref:hypothetical protein n=1 Tax=Streptomyces europaeiscabiei TaxID=146819 RepID=UPI0029BC4BED|nr:hypothetical protein [Streptomyces europaeiscabiei]MDX3691978.1 hypothetical protein [Streptomyces europaeiscabiei]